MTEPLAARKLSELIPDDTGMFLANSMPIREMDMFAMTSNRTPVVGANRGASGIDGLIASASGFSVGLKQPVTLLIGDLAFLHDLNSLKMLTQMAQPVIIIILNNDGGAIFSFLPIAEFPDQFEKLFGTPHGLKFENTARQFALDYYHPKTADDFKSQYATALKKRKSAIIEITTDRKENLELHRTIQKKIKTALEGKK